MKNAIVVGTLFYWSVAAFFMYCCWAFGIFDQITDWSAFIKFIPLVVVFVGIQWWVTILNFATPGD